MSSTQTIHNQLTSQKFWSFLSLLCLMLVGSVAQAVDVDSVRLWRAPDHTRLVFDLDGPIQHHMFSLDNPSRLVLDLKKANLVTKLAGLPLDNTPVSAVRSGVRNGSDLRVVLDLRADVRPKSFFLAKHGEMNDRLVVDLYDKGAVAKTAPAREVVTLDSGQRDIVIAIDAGHGGEDPGALGPKFGSRRLREKDVVMSIAKELATLVNREKGYKAELVRTGDYYIPLRERRNIARRKRADLFVSIHADAFTSPQAKGASVFALSRHGATSEMARFLAEQENEADLIGGVGGVSLGDKDVVLQGVLVDLSMTATLASSLQVGEDVLKSMGGIAKLHRSRVEQAGFAVLKSPDVPSILVETGFISNPDEAARLNSSAYRRKLAKSLVEGIKTHFERVPPAGTYVAWVKNGGRTLSPTAQLPTAGGSRTHITARGDTLSGIAQQYDVSVKQIQQLNQLSSSTIRVGQRLLIPAS